MIRKTSFHRLNNNELNTLITRIITAVKLLEGINTGVIAKILAVIIQLNNQFTKSLNTSFKTEYGKILKALDGNRDDAFRALRDYLLASSRRLNETFRLHAQKLMDLIRTHGWSLWNENYQEESSKMNSLIVDFESEESQASLTALLLTEWFEEMKKAQADFENAFQDKASDDIKKDFVALRKLRPKLIDNTYELLDRINTDAKYTDTPEVYTELIKVLNNIIEETLVLAKSRKTRDEHDEDE